jgi:N-acetylglucosamine-6-phosphate deacetylase
MRNLYLTNATIVLEKSILYDGYVHIKEEKSNLLEIWVAHLLEVDSVFDCTGKQYVIPGMIDIHVHGAAGFDFMDSSHKAFEGIAQALAKEGTTSYLATTMTNPVKHISKALLNLSKYMGNSNGAGVAEMVGVHLEGPFINKEQKGAQPEKEIIPPNVTLFKEWQELARETIKIITFAPELDNNFELLTELREMGVLPSMGHTNASYDCCQQLVME